MSVVNPSALSEYQIIGDKDDKEKSNLVKAFTTLTLGELFRSREPKGDPNFISKDFKVSLIHIAKLYTGARKPIRVMFGDEAQSVGLIVDVLCIKQIPRVDDGSLDPSVLEKSLHDPVLIVRYKYSTRKEVSPTLFDILRLSTNEIVSKGGMNCEVEEVVMSIKSTVAEIDFALKLLKVNEGLLPDSYKESFKLESPFNQSGDFRPSFIMPSKDNVVMESKKMPENLRVCSLPGCKLSERDDLILKKCSGCKSADYCSKDHQVEHWKIHKLVCKKKASELEIDPNRPSFVISLISNLPDGMSHFSASLNSSARSVSSNGKLPRNIHGDNEFFIKIQTPLFGTGPLAIYDSTKSFQTTLKDHPQCPTVIAMVKRYGPPNPHPGFPPGKAYFAAKREGSNLRIFIDKVGPMQPW